MKTPILIIRQAFVIAALVVLILSVNAGCSSGGDGDVVDIPATVPDVLNYEIRQGTGIFLNLNQGGDATVTSTLLSGTFNRITQAFTLNVQPDAMTVGAGDFLSQLDADLGNTDFSNYRLHITTSAAWVGDGDPTSGKFEIFDDEVRKITISVIADADNTGLPGVQITYWPDGEGNPGSSVSEFTWDDFDGLFDNQTAEPYARIAAFAHSLLRFMYDQGELVIQGLELISENDTLLEETGTVEQNCDTFYPLTPTPAVSYDPGFIKVNWTDVNHDNGLGPGDTVYLGFTECWVDDDTDTFDTLYDRTINLVNYTEVENAGVLTRIGFEPSGSADGGVDFDYLKITETETTPPNVIIKTGETITLSGGFSMVFTAP
jgi:hypothetical protein